MTPREQRNSDATDGWNQAWNTDIDEMVDRYYAPDCEVVIVQTGEVMHGREELRLFERGLQRTLPERGVRVVTKVVGGDYVAVELERDSQSGGGSVRCGCVVLRFNSDGQIASDHSYAYLRLGPSTAAMGIDPDHFCAEMMARGRDA